MSFVNEQVAINFRGICHGAAGGGVLVLWDQMPRYRFMARIARIPGLYQILDWGYERIVARIIYERHLRRKAKGLVNSVHE